MGEAKRRSKNNPNYVRFFNLSPTAAQTQHSRLVINELFAAFAPEFETLIRTRTFPDNYQPTCTRVSDWLDRRLLRYREDDREYIARFILNMIAQLDDSSVVDRYKPSAKVSPVLLCCLFQATKSYFSDETLSKMKLRLQKVLEQFIHHHETQFFARSVLEHIDKPNRIASLRTPC